MARVDWHVLLPRSAFQLYPPVPRQVINLVEAELGSPLPSELLDLYLTSDGVLDLGGQWFVIWPLARLIEHNRAAWANEPADLLPLLAFGDDGTGNPFCIRRTGTPGIVVWNPIDGAAYHLADTLDTFWRGWNDGTITT